VLGGQNRYGTLFILSSVFRLLYSHTKDLSYPFDGMETHDVHNKFKKTAYHNIGNIQPKMLVEPLGGVLNAFTRLHVEPDRVVVLEVRGIAPLRGRETVVHATGKGAEGVDKAG
jgi:hypothetical protein